MSAPEKTAGSSALPLFAQPATANDSDTIVNQINQGWKYAPCGGIESEFQLQLRLELRAAISCWFIKKGSLHI